MNMKNFQRNLFIVLAIGLCGICGYQWYLQAVQLRAIETLNETIFKQSADIQGYTNSIKTMDDEISQLQGRIAELKRTAMSNDEWAITEKRMVVRLQSDGEMLSNGIVEYKAAVSDLTNKLSQAYAGEKDLATQRDGFVEKLNKSVKAQNDLTLKYNQLVDRFNKLQTNPAPQ
jgi:chromosome segregation ATPase